MARSTSLIVLLAALVIQVVLACSGLDNGIYLIQFDDKSLTAGRIPHVFPPPDVPALALYNFETPWLIESTEGGYTISDPRYGDRFIYGLSVVGGHPMVSVKKNAVTWAVTPAGPGHYTIQVANENLLLTAPEYEGPVTLEPADGNPAQRWILTRVGYRNLYPNRFQHIL